MAGIAGGGGGSGGGVLGSAEGAAGFRQRPADGVLSDEEADKLWGEVLSNEDVQGADVNSLLSNDKKLVDAAFHRYVPDDGGPHDPYFQDHDGINMGALEKTLEVFPSAKKEREEMRLYMSVKDAEDTGEGENEGGGSSELEVESEHRYYNHDAFYDRLEL